MLRGTELCEERLWEMGRSRLEKKGLWGADSRSAGATRVHRGTQQDIRHKLQCAGVTNLEKRSFLVRTAKPQNKDTGTDKPLSLEGLRPE